MNFKYKIEIFSGYRMSAFENKNYLLHEKVKT